MDMFVFRRPERGSAYLKPMAKPFENPDYKIPAYVNNEPFLHSPGITEAEAQGRK